MKPKFWVLRNKREQTGGVTYTEGQKKLYSFQRSIRIQLILVMGISILAGLGISSITWSELKSIKGRPYIDYRMGKEQIDSEAYLITQQLKKIPILPESSALSEISNVPYTPQDIAELLAESGENPIKNFACYLDQEAKAFNAEILLVTNSGDILFNSGNAAEVKVDIHKTIYNAMNYRTASLNYQAKEYSGLYPIDADRWQGYVIVNRIPSAQIVYYPLADSAEMTRLLIPLTFILTFVIIFLLLTRNKMQYLQHLAFGLVEMSKGNLNYRVDQKYNDELGSLARNINNMAEELQQKIEQERLGERMKTELITNVSHDLRTPLTSIMGYLRLLIDQKYDSPEQAENFLSIAFSKSEKLKDLIDDLFDYTKLTNEEIIFTKERISISKFLEQLIDELVPIAEEQGIQIKTELPASNSLVSMDANKLIRVYENLIMNAVYYSTKPGEVLIRLWTEDQYVITGIYNFGEGIPPADLPFVFERFYRVEKSRSSNSGGSGLGLAIAKQIVELHGGEIWAESEGEEVRFYIKLYKDT